MTTTSPADATRRGQYNSAIPRFRDSAIPRFRDSNSYFRLVGLFRFAR